jgi:hypothetical protein
MKPYMIPIRMARWPAAILIALLASCGGGGDGSGGSSVSTSSNAMPMTSSTTALGATLNGAQETPPNSSAATGTATVNVDTTAKSFTATVTTNSITGTVAHIHAGAPGVAGPILFPLTESPAGSGTWKTTSTLSDTQLQDMLAGRYYVNVHSAAFPAGEIRGQLIVASSGGGY